MRKPVVSGTFYPSNKDELLRVIEEKIQNKAHGPGKLEHVSGVIGAVVPHAGYIFSGYVAAYVYSKLKSYKNYTFIIIGPNHTGYGTSVSVSAEDEWMTPLGKVKVDKRIAEKIVENSKYATFDDVAHLYEHSVEVQLPFLQYVLENEFKIVPIALMDQSKEIAIDLANSILETENEKTIVIASSDFTHYEPHMIAIRKDGLLIKRITSLSLEEFYLTLRKENVSACGYGAIATLIEITRKLQGKIELLKYMTSGDITKDYSSVVGYAALLSRKEK